MSGNTYAKRTCSQCGARHPQPEMSWHDEVVKTGTSERALMARNVLGFLGGLAITAATGNRSVQRTASRAVLGWAVGNQKRQYKREVRHWYCQACTAELVASGELEYLT